MGISEEDRGSLDKTLKDLKLNKDEVDKFTKAFKDPEFLKMFEEYAKEMQDPKVREETDQYLRQVEFEGRVEEVYGKGVQLVAPDASYVVKTSNLSNSEKVFINVCTAEKIEVASKRRGTSPDGKTGSFFDVPLSLGTIKKGTDKLGGTCSVFDFVVHPDTVKMGDENPAIRNLIVETAMEKVESVHPDWKLDRKYRLPKMKYKASEGCPKPQVLAFRAPGSKAESVSGRIRPQGKGGSPMPPPADLIPAAGKGSNPVDAVAAAPADAPADAGCAKGTGNRSTFSFGAGKKAHSKIQEVEVTDPTKAGYKHANGAITPSWELIHRGEVDLADTWGDAGRNLSLSTTIPKEIVVRLKLPNVTSASGVDLDVSRSRLVASVPGKYHLETALPFAVKEALGRARFDKARQQLEITLPVIPPPMPPSALPLRQAGEHLKQEEEAAEDPPLVQELPSSSAAGDAAADEDADADEDETDGQASRPGQPGAGAQSSSAESGASLEAQSVGEGCDASAAVASSEESSAADGSSAKCEGSSAAAVSAAHGVSSEAEVSEIRKIWNEQMRKKKEEEARVKAEAAAAAEAVCAAGGSGGSNAGQRDGAGPEGAVLQQAAEMQAPAVLLKPRLNKSLAEELD